MGSGDRSVTQGFSSCPVLIRSEVWSALISCLIPVRVRSRIKGGVSGWSKDETIQLKSSVAFLKYEQFSKHVHLLCATRCASHNGKDFLLISDAVC